MRIASSTVRMRATHKFQSRELSASRISTVSLTGLNARAGSKPFAGTNLGTERAANRQPAGNSQDSLNNLKNRYLQSQGVNATSARDAFQSMMEIKKGTIDYLMQLFFGKSNVDAMGSSLASPNLSALTPSIATKETVYSYQETEKTSFSTTGTVVTADGREISFNVEASMSRSFQETYYEKTQFMIPASFCDPLVINLDTNFADVTDQKFYFDLDMDGHEEAISQLKAGSGFLALDKNGNGKIDDGSELFGAATGNGFAELAKYDTDGNGWIDEADEIFDKLLIWTKDASGKDVLCGLGKAGVGAIFLGNVGTEFSLNSRHDNSANAQVRKTGLFLYENGTAGTVQHVDFAT